MLLDLTLFLKVYVNEVHNKQRKQKWTITNTTITTKILTNIVQYKRFYKYNKKFIFICRNLLEMDYIISPVRDYDN